jgi:benzoyl-CoA reductase/2-hydroxyglutaryl-CoA dehydratase subunit BcrC/BadD/HgdB
MSDLISRSQLMESLIYCDGLGRKSLEAVIKTISEQPTAYDVDKVVKELEEVIQEHKENASKTSEMSVLVSELKMVGCYSHAIEIVKEVGGMNEA